MSSNQAFSYLRTREWHLNLGVGGGGRGQLELMAEDRERWSAADGQVRVIEQRPNTARSDSTTTAQVEWAPDLPHDPGQLRAYLLKGAPSPQHNVPETLVLIASVQRLHTQAIPSGLAAAFYEILIGQPDLVARGETVDRAGRTGLGYSFEFTFGPARRLTLIFDPESKGLLATEEMLIEPGRLAVEVPAVASYVLYLEQGRVASTDERPVAGLPG
ncbi:hypothetical protein [Kineosporia sp. NBRC 101731]|uniref:hypothetical protein n=1 Tax=Kineosporia sp. NBRC 101731 TaxID=3032199 RepID=UPI0024A57FAB|nr:hypothetical protein [Kineosporia sp. NBRC 101731]GLY31874.1 hypothetical protein Kisp02_52390 [Kineosporia sp. NBRC 101731]